MRAEMVQTTNNCRSGAIRLRSSASLVTIACFALRAQTTTWASTTSAVPVRASNRPTVVASGPSSRIRSVSICRISRDRRACLAGLRMACASAVAGIVMRIPRSFARATSASTLRSFRSKAISPPASNAIPLKRPSLFGLLFSVFREREACRPNHAPFPLTGHPFVEVRLPSSPSNPPHRKEQLQRHAARRQKCSRTFRPRQVRESLRPDRPGA